MKIHPLFLLLVTLGPCAVNAMEEHFASLPVYFRVIDQRNPINNQTLILHVPENSTAASVIEQFEEAAHIIIAGRAFSTTFIGRRLPQNEKFKRNQHTGNTEFRADDVTAQHPILIQLP